MPFGRCEQLAAAIPRIKEVGPLCHLTQSLSGQLVSGQLASLCTP